MHNRRANLLVAVGPVVVSEVLFNPPKADDTLASEFVSLVTNAPTLPAADSFITYSAVDGRPSDAMSDLTDAAMKTSGLESLKTLSTG